MGAGGSQILGGTGTQSMSFLMYNKCLMHVKSEFLGGHVPPVPPTDGAHGNNFEFLCLSLTQPSLTQPREYVQFVQ